MKGLLVLAAAAVAVAGTVLLLQSGGAQATGPHADLLQQLGEAYATDYGTKLERVETRVAATVAADNAAELTGRLQQALAVGLVGKQRSLRPLALAEMQDVLTLQMTGGRTPAAVVAGMLQPGAVLVEASWTFAQGPAVASLAVFTGEGDLAFDSLLSFPAMPEGLFFPKHF